MYIHTYILYIHIYTFLWLLIWPAKFYTPAKTGSCCGGYGGDLISDGVGGHTMAVATVTAIATTTTMAMAIIKDMTTANAMVTNATDMGTITVVNTKRIK